MRRMHEIHGLLSDHLNSLTLSLGLEVQWDGSSFIPDSEIYLREVLLLGDAGSASLGRDAPSSSVAIYQIDILTPLNGFGVAYSIGDAIVNHFRRGDDLKNDNCRIVFRNAKYGIPTKEGVKYKVVVSIPVMLYSNIN